MDLFTGAEQEVDCLTLPVKLAFKRLKKTDKNIAHKAICWWTKGPFYHVEVIIGDVWISSTSKGTHIKKLDEDLSNWDILDIRDVTITQQQYDDIIAWLKQHEGKKYDWLAIVYSQVIPWSIESSKRWICSEITVRVLQLLSYREVQDVKPYDISPNGVAFLFNYK